MTASISIKFIQDEIGSTYNNENYPLNYETESCFAAINVPSMVFNTKILIGAGVIKATI